jgi:membrane glycosyltransferase
LLAIAAPFSDLVIWMAPILIGLLFSAPIAVMTSSVAAGQFARRMGMFVTPEELASPMLVEPEADVVTEEAAAPTYA